MPADYYGSWVDVQFDTTGAPVVGPVQIITQLNAQVIEANCQLQATIATPRSSEAYGVKFEVYSDAAKTQIVCEGTLLGIQGGGLVPVQNFNCTNLQPNSHYYARARALYNSMYGG